MQKNYFFSLSITAFLLISLFWFGCQKDANQLQVANGITPTSIQEMDATDRGGGQCGGQISLSAYYLGEHGEHFQAVPSFQDWHVKIETRACSSQPWTTVFEFDDDAPNAFPPTGAWVNFSPILHDQFYRITVTNEDDVNLPIRIFSRIQNAIEANNGFTSSITTSIGQGETKSFEYFNLAGLWKGNCGFLWKHDCNPTGGE